jgi:hypothetical protein
MSEKQAPALSDLNPEAVLARATQARGDIFPEWKPLAYASPKTYRLVNETVRYLHHYDAGSGAVDIAADHIRRAYDCGMSRRQVLEAICCVVPMTGMLSAQYGARAMKIAEETIAGR